MKRYRTVRTCRQCGKDFIIQAPNSWTCGKECRRKRGCDKVRRRRIRRAAEHRDFMASVMSLP